MRSPVLSNRLHLLSRVAVLALLAGVTTGCSSDFTRFDRNLYAALPQSANQSANNQYPADVDRTTTASIRSGNPHPMGTVSIPKGVSDDQAYKPVDNYSNRQAYNPAPSYNSGVVKAALPSATGQMAAPARAPLVDSIKTGAITPAVTKKAEVVAMARPAAQKAVAPVVAAAPVAAASPMISNGVGGWSSAGGTAVSLRDGETLYNLSKRYGVPVTEIMKANNIQNADAVQAGQQVLIPNYVYSRSAPVSAPDNNPGTNAASSARGLAPQANAGTLGVPTQRPQQVAALAPETVSTSNSELPHRKPKPLSEENTKESVPDYSIVTGSVKGTGTYTVASGDTLSKIASRNGTTVTALTAANGLTSSNLKIGQVLKLPGAVASNAVAASATGVKPAQEKAPQQYTKPTVDQTVTSTVDTKAPETTGISNLRWPVNGKIVTAFGKPKNSQANDGIDISVPEGTAVKAAENGVVIYSGSDLQNFGNLVLIRHQDGLVTAYAHNKSNSVAKDAVVKRGQVIAISGRTGATTTPMLHFEVRKDSKPVNPTKYLGG